MGTNDRTNWERRLAGEVVPMIGDDNPDYGFYRVRTRDKQSWRPVAYWYTEDGALRCLLDGKLLDELRACELWTWACKNAITHELYEAVTKDGAPWPDLSEAVTRSNNAPSDNSFESIKDRIEDIAREAEKITAVADQNEADRAADLANKLGELQNTADTQRADEKKPHDDAAKAVQAKWKPVVDAADAAKRRIKGVIAAFLAAKETAERKAREDAVKAGAPMPEPEQRASTTKAGTRGRAVSLKTVKDANITDRAALLAHFAEHPDITDALQNLANRAVRAGIVPPGVSIIERKVAA